MRRVLSRFCDGAEVPFLFIGTCHMTAAPASRIVVPEMLATFDPRLVRVARKVVWYDSPEEALADLPEFLTHLMV